MASERKPFNHHLDCPVVKQKVTITGLVVSQAGASAYTNLSCTNIQQCLAKLGPIEGVPNCLLHKLKN